MELHSVRIFSQSVYARIVHSNRLAGKLWRGVSGEIELPPKLDSYRRPSSASIAFFTSGSHSSAWGS